MICLAASVNPAPAHTEGLCRLCVPEIIIIVIIIHIIGRSCSASVGFSAGERGEKCPLFCTFKDKHKDVFSARGESASFCSLFCLFKKK